MTDSKKLGYVKKKYEVVYFEGNKLLDIISLKFKFILRLVTNGRLIKSLNTIGPDTWDKEAKKAIKETGEYLDKFDAMLTDIGKRYNSTKDDNYSTAIIGECYSLLIIKFNDIDFDFELDPHDFSNSGIEKSVVSKINKLKTEYVELATKYGLIATEVISGVGKTFNRMSFSEFTYYEVFKANIK